MKTSTMRLQLSVWAQDLPNSPLSGDIIDPFAVVTLLTEDSDVPLLIGQTEVLSKTKNPDWTKLFYIENFQLGKASAIVVTLYDFQNKEQPIGSRVFDLDSMVSAKGNVVAKELKEGGIILAHVQQATASGIFEFQLRGLQLSNAEGFGLMTTSNPFFEFQRLRPSVNGNGKWTCDAVFRSPYRTNDLDPLWAESSLEVDALCGGHMNQKIRLAVYNFKDSGNHEEIGSVLLSLRELLDAEDDTALCEDKKNMKMKKVFTLTKAGSMAGQILVAKAKVIGAVAKNSNDAVDGTEVDIKLEDIEVFQSNDAKQPDVREPTFVNYVSGGCDLRVMVGIDCTELQDESGNETSLHNLKTDGRNCFEEVIFSLCSILSKYDSDEKFPVWGFGAKKDGKLNNCFPIGLDAEVDGVDGILQAYKGALLSGLAMSGPRVVSEVILKAGENSRNQLQKQQAYSILLLLTNGDPTDPDETLRTLQTIDDAPLSVVIVGIGSGPFEGMQQLENQSKMNGHGDKLRFVRADAINGALDHIPDELVSYFQKRDIYPQPKAVVESVAIDPYHEEEALDIPLTINHQGRAVVSGSVPRGQRRTVLGWLSYNGPKIASTLLHLRPNKTSITRVAERLGKIFKN